MFAQAGLEQLVGPLLAPFILLWLAAVVLLPALMAFGLLVGCVRLRNRWSEQRRER